MAKKIINFTQARIRDLPIPEKGRAEYYDKEAPKLACRVSSSGHKAYYVVKWVKGKTLRVSIGATEDVTVTHARKQAGTILESISAGVDLAAQKQKEKLGKTTLSEALELYIDSHQLKPLTVKDYRYKLKLGFSDWLKKPVITISEDMVLARHKKITKTGRTTANTTMRVLRLTLNYAKALGMIDSNPIKILSAATLWHDNVRKDRIIPSDKLRAWYRAVIALSNIRARAYLLTAMYMGFRSGELLTIEWRHVNLTKKTIRLTDTKNGTNKTFPIPEALIPIIEELQTITGDYKWAFTGDRPKTMTPEEVQHGKPMTAPAKPMRAVTKSTGIEFSPHDIRRTFATIAEAVGLPLTMIKRLMNHNTTNDVTGGYIVTEEETLRKAVNKVASYIQAKVTTESNLIQLHG